MMNSFWWGSKQKEATEIHRMSWDRLSIQKKSSGLGYRNLEGYNLAIGWKCISAPNALSSRLLKAKYFPRKEFLNASIGPNPSFIWRSIWCSQAILAQSIRWKVGNGRSINIRRDHFYMESNLEEARQVRMVSDLIDPDIRQWNINLMYSLFQPRDIKEITKHSPINNGFGGHSNLALQSKWKLLSQIRIQAYYEFDQLGQSPGCLKLLGIVSRVGRIYKHEE